MREGLEKKNKTICCFQKKSASEPPITKIFLIFLIRGTTHPKTKKNLTKILSFIAIRSEFYTVYVPYRTERYCTAALFVFRTIINFQKSVYHTLPQSMLNLKSVNITMKKFYYFYFEDGIRALCFKICIDIIQQAIRSQ